MRGSCLLRGRAELSLYEQVLHEFHTSSYHERLASQDLFLLPSTSDIALGGGKKQQEGFVASPGVVQCAALPSSPGRGWISLPWDLAVTVPNWPLEISRGK